MLPRRFGDPHCHRPQQASKVGQPWHSADPCQPWGPTAPSPQLPPARGATHSTAPQGQRESPTRGSAPPAKDKRVHSSQGHPEGGQKADLFSVLKQENSFLVLKGYNQEFYEAINYLLIIKSKLNVNRGAHSLLKVIKQKAQIHK